MTEQIFSEREGFATPKNIQSYDYLPGWVREAATHRIGDFVASCEYIPKAYQLDLYPLFRPYIWKVLGKKPPNSPMGGPFRYYIPAVLNECPWYEWYDILEEICHLICLRSNVNELKEFSLEINAILARDGIAWKLEQGKVVRVLDSQVTQQIKEVSILLADPKFKGADEQYTKAIGHLNRRPDPDEENCVKDAVGALEAVTNIIAGTNGKQLNDLLKKEPFISGIHTTIRKAIDKVYAYRGAAPGVGHGQVGPAIVKIGEAIWVLAVSSATILYLVNKFPQPSSQ